MDRILCGMEFLCIKYNVVQSGCKTNLLKSLVHLRKWGKVKDDRLRKYSDKTYGKFVALDMVFFRGNIL